MANLLEELLNVCRFCLSENKQYLQPIMKALDSTLTPDEIERYTGIRINTDDDCTLYAICMECTSTLKKSIEYRTNCINNQIHFEELLMMLVASAECTNPEDTETVICLDSDDDGTDLNSIEDILHEESIGLEDSLSYEKDMLQEEVSCIDTIRSYNSPQPSKRMFNDEDEMYSANYILPGESCYSDSDDGESSVTTKKQRKNYTFKKDPPKEQRLVKEKKTYDFSPLKISKNYFVKSYKVGKRIYPKALCDVCGIMVCDINSHVRNHFPATFFPCPHCPVKMKGKTNLKSHIDTVHFKKVGKTCNICGKGFIHHKTYRYHMLGHQSEGKTFECKVCGKIFDKPCGLSDHCKRVHNLARPTKRGSSLARLETKDSQ
ncbi:zinc finger imprinted 3-like [Anopheles maculipalpis]|uniref:zinc finger imprinted 3-like n=1 Tax=Anopheles maculipalpis TaxID=1496333 RepID=UPI0021596914|nr:zinc finger imprinted 3-like [Anopheles maculipalpis]